jgi:hypothetical protein
MSAPYTIEATAAGWRVTWHRRGNATSFYRTAHHAEKAAEYYYGSPLAHLKRADIAAMGGAA